MISILECMAEAKQIKFNKYKCIAQQQSLKFTCANAEWLQKIAIDGNLCGKALEAQERQLGSH